jgi:hypothetical protein
MGRAKPTKKVINYVIKCAARAGCANKSVYLNVKNLCDISQKFLYIDTSLFSHFIK